MPTTNTPQVKIVNVETGEEIIRDMNSEELAQMEADNARQIAVAEAKAQAEADKAALLTRLGITAEEAKLLLQ
jgi:hypothetical protein